MRTLFKLVFLFCLLSACNAGRKHNVSKAEALLEEGKRLEQISQPDSAIVVYYKAINFLPPEHELRINIYHQIGDLFIIQDLYTKALEVYIQAYEASMKHNNQSQMSKSLRSIGKAYLFQDSLKISIDYFDKALEIAPSTDIEEMANVYNNLASAYRLYGEYEKALNFINKSIELCGDSIPNYKHLSTKKDLFMDMQLFDSAWHYALMGCESSDIYTKASSYISMSRVASTLGNPDSVKYMYMFQQLNDSIDRSKYTAAMADIYSQRGWKQTVQKIYMIYYQWGIAVGAVLLVIIFCFSRILKRKKNIINLLERQIEEKVNQLASLKLQLESIPEKINEVESLDIGSVKYKIAESIKDMANLCVKRLRATKVYARIKRQLSSPDVEKIDKKETDELNTVIFLLFIDYINALSDHYTKLTREECLFCCLVESGFTNKECGILMKKSKESLSTQKSRIKNKLYNEFNEFYMFELIFLNNK